MHNHLGSAYYRLGQKPEARDCFERALAVTPGYAEALHNLGVIYAEMQMGGHVQSPRFGKARPIRTCRRRMRIGRLRQYRFAMAFRDAGRRAATLPMKRLSRRKSLSGKNVLEIGTGAGLLALMAARAGAANVTTCETIPPIAERAREIVGRNGFVMDRITVPKEIDLLSAFRRICRAGAEVLITETFASGLITEGALSATSTPMSHCWRQVPPSFRVGFHYRLSRRGTRAQAMLFHPRSGRIRSITVQYIRPANVTGRYRIMCRIRSCLRTWSWHQI